MVIQLSPNLEKKIAALVASGHFADANEVVDAAVQLLEGRERKTERLRSLLLVGYEQEERGELIEYTPELMDELAEESERRFLAGEVPSPDVCP